MKVGKKLVTLLDLCVSSLRRGHANLLCIVPILTDEPQEKHGKGKKGKSPIARGKGVGYFFSSNDLNRNWNLLPTSQSSFNELLFDLVLVRS